MDNQQVAGCEIYISIILMHIFVGLLDMVKWILCLSQDCIIPEYLMCLNLHNIHLHLEIKKGYYMSSRQGLGSFLFL